MRRTDREITDLEEKLGIIRRCKVLRLGMAEQNQPYIVPLNFGFECNDGRLSLYLHSAKEGKKVDILGRNGQVCFEMDGEYSLIVGEQACDYSFAYESIIGFGTAEILEGLEEKIHGLNMLMKHQTGEDREFSFDEQHVRAVNVYRIRVSSFSGKRRPKKD
jgi:nitroimidazol reductase NimA-like FMN-containing flavoprotein (pyridoxamine 5'-phosphate oxidase superfamily)